MSCTAVSAEVCGELLLGGRECGRGARAAKGVVSDAVSKGVWDGRDGRF
jgi:hypothetical protein